MLGYNQWRSINDLIERAKVACKESKRNIDDHFALNRKMVCIGSKAKRNVLDYKLSRYACYLIVMNGNPKKQIIALGQTYFAIQTRKNEPKKESKNLEEQPEEQNNLEILKKLKKGEEIEVINYETKTSETSPPSRYNSGSMILAMENAGKLIEEEELREQIKGAGIGTSATRAEIMKK